MTRIGGFTESRARFINEIADYLVSAGFIRRDGQRGTAVPKSSKVTWFLTPSGGIPARSGTTLGSAVCTRQYIDENDDFQEMPGPDGTAQTHAVKNYAGSAADGSTYVAAVFEHGRYVVISEDCG